MAKGNLGKGKNTSKSSNECGWTFDDHTRRIHRKIDRISKKEKSKNRSLNGSSNGYYKRSFLAHDGKDQIEAKKISLHITKIKRDIEKWRKRLKQWDEIEEQKEIEKQRQTQTQINEMLHNKDETTKKRKRRPGPETWKLRGAARPAYEVYDFDTRYVDPYIKEHEEAKEKAKRSCNLLLLYKGQLGQLLLGSVLKVSEVSKDDNNMHDNEDEKNNNKNNTNTNTTIKGPTKLAQSACRTFLSMLLQLGHLCQEAKKFKSAREAFLECIALEGPQNITNARSHLMRMYMEANRPDSARRLWERFPTDHSVWIRYSAALVEYVSWNLLKEDGSTSQSAERLLAHAVQSNVYCAYYLAFHKTFESVMEFTYDIEDASERSLEEAIEYCVSEQMGSWLGTDGALEWIRNSILIVLQTGKSPCGFINRTHLDWNISLTEAEELFQNQQNNESQQIETNQPVNDDDSNDDNEEKDCDFLMYAGMFRTSIEMLEDAGEFNAKPNMRNMDEKEMNTNIN